MAATKKPSEATVVSPQFFETRSSDINWTLRVKESGGKTHEFVGADWEAVSRFGEVRNVVVFGLDGKPSFDRPEYREAPNVNMVAWGIKDGIAHIAILHEARPHADNPVNPSSKNPMVFGQIPMGFLNKLLGQDRKFEPGANGAVREIVEETGATAVISVRQSLFPWHNPNPTFVATWSELYFVQVDLDKIEALKPSHGEMIYKAEYIPVAELMERIRKGQHKGALYRAATTLSILMIFFATYPQYFPKLKRHRRRRRSNK